jgi:hypothetical protein
MKAQLNAQNPSVSKVVMRLTLLGSVLLAAVYAFLMLCSSAIKIIE